MIGGVTRWGGLSGLKCWNSDNLFDWTDFFKINTYFYFFDERQNVKQKPRILWKHGVVPFDACSFQLILRGACEERAGKRKRTNFDRPFFTYWQVFFLLNFIRETFLCSLNLFSCAQPILIAWTSCLKLIISKIYYFTVVTSAETNTLNEKIHKLTIAKEKNIELIFFFRTLICIT